MEITHGCEHVHKFLLHFGLEHVRSNPYRVEVVEMQFLGRLPEQGLQHPFAVGNMSPDRGVPFQGKKVLAGAALLDIYMSFAIDYVKMDYGMKRLGT